MYFRVVFFILTICIVGAQIQLPAMDATCDSIRAKYEHFSWACGPRSCAEGEKSLHNRYLFEKVRCDSDDPSRICCPTFDYKIPSAGPKTPNGSKSASGGESSTNTTSKKEIDVSCTRITEKYKNRFNWSCEKMCAGGGTEKKEGESINETVSCDQQDESMICCPRESKNATANTTTSLPPTLSTLSSASSKRPSSTTSDSPSNTTSQAETQRTSPSTSTSSARKPVTRTRGTTSAPTKNTIPAANVDVGCKRTRQKYDNSVEWVCEKQPCADFQLNRLNTLIKDKTQCDSTDATKICCAKLVQSSTRKPSSPGQDNGTSTQSQPKTTTITEEITSTTLAVSTPPVSSTPATTFTTDATTLPPSTTLKQEQLPPKPVILSSPDSETGDDNLLQELKKKRYSVFDRDLLSVLAKESPQENIVISPLSIKLLLALIMEGSGGQTSNEILRALQLPLNDRNMASTLLQKLQSLILVPEKSSIIILESHNKIYKAPDVELQDDYKNTVTERYKTDVEQMDFSKPHIAVDHINGWVKNSTHGVIPSLVDEDNIRDNMKLFLVNYIFLKANWDQEFNRQATRSGCFHANVKNPDDCRTVAYMYKKRGIKYDDSEDLDAQIVEIPFKDTRYVVNFVLPNENSNAHELLEKLNRKDLYDLFTNLEQTSVNLQLPRTTIDYSKDMGKVLQHPQLRIKELFRPTADLSGMLSKNARIGISNILHKARIEINEDGTKAAGVSGGGVQVLSLSTERNVVFDRPFLFFIRDTKVGGFLFEGIIVSPDEVKPQEESFESY